MNTDRVWIVIVLLVGIVGLSNLMMFLAVRGMRGGDGAGDWKRMLGAFRSPFKQEDNQLDELRRRVDRLPKDDDTNKD